MLEEQQGSAGDLDRWERPVGCCRSFRDNFSCVGTEEGEERGGGGGRGGGVRGRGEEPAKSSEVCVGVVGCDVLRGCVVGVGVCGDLGTDLSP